MHVELTVKIAEITAIMDRVEAADVLVALRRGCKDHLDTDQGGRGPRSPDTCGSCRLATHLATVLKTP